MSEEKKYSLLTNSDIEEGLQNDLFQKEDIALIRDKEGKIVRHLPLTTSKNSIIPPSLIQINNTYIYQADIEPIIDALIETRNVGLFQDLSEKHQIVIDSLSYYKDHNARLDELNSKSLEASSIFENRVDKYLENININELDKVDVKNCISMLDSYINIIFIYLISIYWLHKSKVSNDTIAKRKIEKLEEKVRNIYEQLLTESKVDDNDTAIIPMHNSLYAKYLLEESNGIQEIEKLIKHDSRFSSVTDFMGFIQRCFLKKEESYYDYSRQYQVPARFEISISLNDNVNTDKKLELTLIFFNVLEKIEILKNIHSEIGRAGEVNFSKIKTYGDQKANNALHLSVIPLALHRDK